MELFGRATKQKLRFMTEKGYITSEDVWDLPLKHKNGNDLDTLARHYHKLLKEDEEASFVDSPKNDPVRTANKLCFDIILKVIESKKADVLRAEKAAETRELEAKIQNVIQAKKDSSLQELTLEELQARLIELKKD